MRMMGVVRHRSTKMTPKKNPGFRAPGFNVEGLGSRAFRLRVKGCQIEGLGFRGLGVTRSRGPSVQSRNQVEPRWPGVPCFPTGYSSQPASRLQECIGSSAPSTFLLRSFDGSCCLRAWGGTPPWTWWRWFRVQCQGWKSIQVAYSVLRV
jgi:hypothetical protein